MANSRKLVFPEDSSQTRNHFYYVADVGLLYEVLGDRGVGSFDQEAKRCWPHRFHNCLYYPCYFSTSLPIVTLCKSHALGVPPFV